MRSHIFLACAALCALSVGPSVSFAALANKATNKAKTSSTTSSTPTAQKQAELMDPTITTDDDPGDELQLTFVRLDLEIQYTNVPDHLKASNLIEGITITPLPGFEAVPSEPLPFYDGSTSTISSSNVSMDQNSDGRTVIIHDIAVQLDPSNPPPFGEVNHAEVDIHYFDFLTTDAYDNIDATFTVFPTDGDDGAEPVSEVDAQDVDGTPFSFTGPEGIDPASSSQTLGGVDVPEPAMLGALGLVSLIGMRKRRSVG
jgi:hypothetical protein